MMLLALVACVASHHPVTASELGVARSSDVMVAMLDAPGPASVETVVSVDWEVPLSGLLDLKDPAAKAAGLEDRTEPIQVFFHVIRHPTYGTWLVDTGMETAVRDQPDEAAIHGMVASVMKVDRMVHHDLLGDWLARNGPVDGAFLTHLHVDHASGAPDLADSTPIWTGPGEASTTQLQNAVVRPILDQQIEGKPALREWAFSPDEGGRFEGVIDIFGDGSVWALWVPGHTAGSTAFVVRTAEGPVLLTGDASHTRWGWDHGVPPGTYSEDVEASKVSLQRLKALSADHPAMDVRVGHQR